MEHYKGSSSAFRHAQREVISYIHSNACKFTLPTLTDREWDSILKNDLEREKLEFFGDSVINEAISALLVQTWPNETPQFYTVTRSALTSNLTFSHLMSKAQLYSLDGPIGYKTAADAFESILGLFHRAQGRQSFHDWFSAMFPSIARVAVRAASKHFSQSQRSRCAGKNKVLMNYRTLKSELPASMPPEAVDLAMLSSSDESQSEEEDTNPETDEDEDMEPKLNDEDSRRAIHQTIARSPFIRKPSAMYELGTPVLETPSRPSTLCTPGRWNNPIFVEDTPTRSPTIALSQSTQLLAGVPVTPVSARVKTLYTPGRAENPIILF